MSESCELWKTKRTRAHIYKYKCMNTHINTHIHTHTYTHWKYRFFLICNSALDHTHTHTHTQIHTHSNTHTHTYTHAHKDTRMHASVRSRAPTHTKCSFVIGGQNLWSHLPDNVKEVGSIELFKQILKTIIFSQSFEIPDFLKICNSALGFIWFIGSKKNDSKCPTSSLNTPVSKCAMYGTLW